MTPAEFAAAIRRLVEEKNNMRSDLQRYGDHTIDCLAAPTERCICGWAGVRHRWNIRPRDEDSK